MHLADRIVVLSEWIEQRLVLLGGIHLSKILVLQSGTDTDLYHPLGKRNAARVSALIRHYIMSVLPGPSVNSRGWTS